jgi:DNA-directed RNA polymerase omega subunit
MDLEEQIPEEDETEPTIIDSKFRLVLVAANRAEQLIRGARPKIEAGKRKATRLAMEEVQSNLVDWGYGPAPQPQPEPEAELVEQPDTEVH